MEKEKTIPVGYREGGPMSKVKSVSIQISMWKMQEMLEQLEFKILNHTASFDGEGEDKVFHGQYGVVFMKEPIVPKLKRHMVKNNHSKNNSLGCL